jgi:transposase
MIKSKKIFSWYKNHLSGFNKEETQLDLTKDDVVDSKTGELISVPILKIDNFGEDMCVDEKSLGDEVYTIIHNPKIKKIALMAMTTKLDGLKQALDKVPSKIRLKVKTISKDLASNYEWLALQYFSFAERVADKFHIIKMGFEGLQAIRVRYRQELLTKERETKKKKQRIINKRYENEETEKELLARSRGLLFKFPNEWSSRQEERARILFREYPEIYKAYTLMLEFRRFYKEKDRKTALVKLERWRVNVQNENIPEMLNFNHQIETHQGVILNYFNSFKTNASAECLNSHLQRFFINNYGIRNRDFFHFRIKLAFS